MKKLINGKVVEFNSSTNRPDRITVDGIVYSTGRMENEEGYSWRTSGDGNILYYKQIYPTGDGIVSYPQRLFTTKKHLKSR